MPDDKGILTEAELLKLASGSPAPTPFGEIRRLVQSGYDAGRQATLDALAKVTDEELIREVTSVFRDGNFSDPPDWKVRHVIERCSAYFAARHQKELEEAVKQAKKEVWDEAAQSTAEAIDAQVKMERERIKNLLREGYLEKHWPNCDAQLSHWEEIWKVLRGEWPGGKVDEDVQRTYT